MILASPPPRAKQPRPPKTIQEAAKLFASAFQEAFHLAEVIQSGRSGRGGRGSTCLSWRGPGSVSGQVSIGALSGYVNFPIVRLAIWIPTSPRTQEITLALGESESFARWLGGRIADGETILPGCDGWPVPMVRSERWGRDYQWTQAAMAAVGKES